MLLSALHCQTRLAIAIANLIMRNEIIGHRILRFPSFLYICGMIGMMQVYCLAFWGARAIVALHGYHVVANDPVQLLVFKKAN